MSRINHGARMPAKLHRMGGFAHRLVAASCCCWAAAALAFTTSLTLGKGRARITAYDYGAWAICSLKVGDYEYLDSFDHGRCLQSAASFDGRGEAFNPTQAGGARDGRMPGASSSLPLRVHADPRTLDTTVRMAFWEPLDFQRTSAWVHRQRVTVGLGPRRNVIRHEISFEMPAGETHASGQFENLTGYMPPEFARFRTLDPASGKLAELTDGPGEQPWPVIFCTQDDAHCMGVISPGTLAGGGYGRWRFPGWACVTRAGPTGCVKWNVVTRTADPPGQYLAPPIYTAVGGLDDVVAGLRWAWSSRGR